MRRGLALILVVGILGVLAVLGSAFAVLSRLERKSASLRVAGTQALLLARSGMEDARARLDAGQDAAYAGEDFNDNKSLDAGPETANQVFKPALLNRDDCPVSQALRPSFFKTVGLNPQLVQVGGRMRGFSGRLAAGNWAVKAAPAGGFHVNGGDPSVQSNPFLVSNLNTALRRMLGILAEAIDREDGTADSLPVGKTDGENLILKRPLTKRGWESFEQIRALALGGSQAKLDALKDYLVLSAWTDRKVIGYTIDAMAGTGNEGYRSQNFLRTGEWVRGSFPYDQVPTTRVRPDLERIPFFDFNTGDPAGPVVGRAPVDLAWARTRRPALIALTANLKGFYWREYCGDRNNPCIAYGYLKPADLALNWASPSDDCRSVVGALLSSTAELGTWEQWNAFCDALPLTGDSGLGQAKKELLKANFNPNTDANKLNPEEAMFKSLDKSDIRVGSTEFHLGPPRAWRISACGRASGRAPASRVLSGESFPDRLFRLTTQSEFVAGNLGNPDRAGDESAFRAYGATPYLTVSNGTSRTFGHKLPGSLDRGFSLQTYPEIPSMWTAGTYGTPPLWDGQLKLATVETADGEYAGTGIMKFLARWDDGWNADYSSGGGSLTALTDTFSGGPGRALWPDEFYYDNPANLLPNGGYLDQRWMNMTSSAGSGSVPGYRSAGNLSPYNGTISYWFKPSYDTTRHGAYFDGGQTWRVFPRTHFNNSRWRFPPPQPGSHGFASFVIAAGNHANADFNYPLTTKGFAFDWACEFGTTGEDHQIQVTQAREVRPRWQLMTVFWDMVSGRVGAATHYSSRILVDRGTDAADRNSPVSYAQLFDDNINLDGDPLVDFTAQAPVPSWYCPTTYLLPENQSAYFFLGYRGLFDDQGILINQGGPDATVDEFAIYDLGLSTANGIALTEALATQRYAAGRYYKESDYPVAGGLKTPLGVLTGRTAGEWFSAPVDLGDVRVRSLSWTQIVPKGMKGLTPVPAGTPKEDYDNPPNEVPDGRDGRVALELAHRNVQVPAVGGTDYALDRWGGKIDALFLDPRGERILRRVSEPFRFHAVFQPRLHNQLGEAANKAVLDPLVLDDVTLTYRDPILPAFSGWRDGE